RHLVPGGGRTGNRRRFRNRGSLRRRNPLEAPGGTLRRQQRRVEAGEGDRSPENEIPPFPLQNRRLRQRQGLVRQKPGAENGRRQKSGRPMVRRRLGDPELVIPKERGAPLEGCPFSVSAFSLSMTALCSPQNAAGRTGPFTKFLPPRFPDTAASSFRFAAGSRLPNPPWPRTARPISAMQMGGPLDRGHLLP